MYTSRADLVPLQPTFAVSPNGTTGRVENRADVSSQVTTFAFGTTLPAVKLAQLAVDTRRVQLDEDQGVRYLSVGFVPPTEYYLFVPWKLDSRPRFNVVEHFSLQAEPEILGKRLFAAVHRIRAIQSGDSPVPSRGNPLKRFLIKIGQPIGPALLRLALRRVSLVDVRFSGPNVVQLVPLQRTNDGSTATSQIGDAAVTLANPDDAELGSTIIQMLEEYPAVR